MPCDEEDECFGCGSSCYQDGILDCAACLHYRRVDVAYVRHAIRTLSWREARDMIADARRRPWPPEPRERLPSLVRAAPFPGCAATGCVCGCCRSASRRPGHDIIGCGRPTCCRRHAPLAALRRETRAAQQRRSDVVATIDDHATRRVNRSPAPSPSPRHGHPRDTDSSD